MKHVLLVEDEEDISELFAMAIEAHFKCRVTQMMTGNKAVAFLNENRDPVDVVVADYKMPDGNGDVVYALIQKKFPETPFVLSTGSREVTSECPAFSQFPNDRPQNFLLYKPYSISEFIELLRPLLHEKEKRDMPEYWSVRGARLLLTNTVPCDVYVRLSDDKFVKLIHSNEVYEHMRIQNYIDKGTELFYVKGEDFLRYSESYFQLLKARLADRKVEVEHKIQTQLSAAAAVREYVLQTGMIDVAALDIMDKAIETTMSVLEKKPALLEFIQAIRNGHGFLSEHSIMTSYVACAIARKMDLNADSTIKKLGLASLLHDAYLNDSLSAVQSLDDDAAAGLSWSDKEAIRKHPLQAAELLRSLNDVYPDVDTIILCHHERSDETGFPRKIGSGKIPPLAALFIVAEELAIRLYHVRGTISDEYRADLQGMLKTKFSYGNFKASLQGALAVCQERG